MREEIEEIVTTRVILVGVDTGEEADFEQVMAELKSLAESCHKEVVGIITQKMEMSNKALYIGSGKVAEVRELANRCQAEEIIVDNILTPSQIRNLGRELELPIIDRTNLILDIFALRAKTKEAKLQVETAKLQYMLPRLVGLHEALGRQGGASGSMSNKGTGEKKIELDRRRIEHRISELRKELNTITQNRETQRKKRFHSKTPQVALVGYTNAGKSTIMNRMVEKYSELPEKVVLEKDMLFATLETSVRNIETGDHRPFFLVDTVGFIHNLPHGLVQAFHSTLEEVKYADLLVHVVDFSDENYKLHMEDTQKTLKELEAGDIPQIIVYNKADKCNISPLPYIKNKQIYMAAGKEIGIQELAELIKDTVYSGNVDCEFLFPYSCGADASYIMENSKVKSMEYLEEGIKLSVNCHSQDATKYDIFKI